MKFITSIILAILLPLGTVYADKPEHAGKKEYKEKKQKKAKYKKEKKQKHVKKHFSGEDKSRVSKYYKTLPPGLAKKLRRGGGLPHGWQTKVRIGQPIPYEYLRYAEAVPPRLESQLSVGPIGSQVLKIADRVVRIEAGTNMVLDAIRF
jgi:hypothetical protein